MTKYLIGIDVGGTNTDSVLLDPNRSLDNNAVLAWNKQLTTHNVSKGIESSLNELFKNNSSVLKNDILSVTIGTTHFINSIVERDQARLEKVAVLRLCGPYSKNAPPFTDFPKDLTNLLNGYSGFLNGGHHVDGALVQEIDEDEVLRHVAEIKKLGIKAVAITGIFSPIFPEQEIKVAEIIQKEIPDSYVVTSNELSGIGLLERENLTILNASVKRFASKIIKMFAKAVKICGIDAPILLTQNDGTVLTIEEALKIPIKTFSSGTTNSMRGASFLLNKFEGQSVIVVDVGGTTTDVGLLLPNGYPRKTSSFSFIGGVKTRLSMPQVESIGLGGGSIVRSHGDHVTIGPDSVGNDFTRSIVGGGEIWTTSDIAVSNQLINPDENNPIFAIGDKERVRGKVTDEFNRQYAKALSLQIEKVIDRMKTSPNDIPVLLVGGGSFVLPNKIRGASEVWRPKFFQVANAIGAAIGKISSIAQSFGKAHEKDAIIERLKKEATAKAIKNGALASTVNIVDVSTEEVPYANISKFEVKVIADVDYSSLSKIAVDISDKEQIEFQGEEIEKNVLNFQEEEEIIDYTTYRPEISSNDEWIISKVDLDFLRIGTYILGCGGGGDPYPQYLMTRNLVEKGLRPKVIDADFKKNYSSLSVAFCGSPSVSNERLQGTEIKEAYNLVNFDRDIDTVVALEIGGGNGFQSLLLGAELNKYVIDADLMGRAYPMIWQITPVVLSEDSVYSPCAVSDGNGNDIIFKRTKTNRDAESIIRAALTEMGSFVGMVSLIKDANSLVIKNSISLAWRIGKAVLIAKQKSDIVNIPEYIINAVKPTDAKKLFEGKIVGVEKKLHKGYNFGEVIIENSQNQILKIPFQNENLVARIDGEVVASVPDLITVIDADTGEAIGTPDYKYGLVVFVIAISPCNHWTDTKKGLEIGGPSAFNFDDVEYKPIGKYTKPRSVIDEYR